MVMRFNLENARGLYVSFLIGLLARLTSSTQLCNTTQYILDKECHYSCLKQQETPTSLICEDDGARVVKCHEMSCSVGSCESFSCLPAERQPLGKCHDKAPPEIARLCAEVHFEEKGWWSNLLILPIAVIPALILVYIVVRHIRPHIQRDANREAEPTWVPLKSSSFSSQQQFEMSNGFLPQEFVTNDDSIPKIRIVPPSLEEFSYLDN